MENKKQKKPTKEEIAKAREKIREIALKNLKAENLSNLAIAYFANSKDSGYGEKDNAAVEDFLYFPALNSGTKAYDFEKGEEYDLIRDTLLSSREDERRYSGKISEYDIIKKSADIIRQSLLTVKVEDIMNLMGSKVQIKKDYKGKYIEELSKVESEEVKNFIGQLIGGYIEYKTMQGVSSALSQRADKLKGGLEKLVGEDKKDKK